MKSILAGVFIALGALVYLPVGGVAGAVLFSVGLLAVLRFDAELFTGKAGLLATKEISVWKLGEIWCGNFLGTALITFIIGLTPRYATIAETARNIVQVRKDNGFAANLMLGILCGILMYIAVKGFLEAQPIYAILPVAVFILAGFNHCVADMMYCNLVTSGYETLIPTTVGNLAGCCFIPWVLQQE